MRRIGIDAVSAGAALGATRGGMHVYFQEILGRLCAAAPDLEFVLLEGRGVGQAAANGASNFRRVRCAGVPASRVARVLYEQVLYPHVVERERLDLFVGTCNVLPLRLRRPAVVIVQSLQFFTHPETYSSLRRAYLRWLVRRSVRQARRVICVSETAKRHLVARTGVASEKVAVIYHGVSPLFRPNGNGSGLAQTGGAPYVLAISALYAFKNFARTIEAFARAKQAACLPHKLLVVGSDGDVTRDELRAVARAAGVDDAVIFLGGLPHDRVPELYAHADLLAFPSLYETFGQPLVEAMASGCPVLTSGVSCMPEIGGDAAELVDPRSVSAIAAGMLRVLTDPARARGMRLAGLARARCFSWDRSARETLAVLREALAEGRPHA